MGKMRLYGATAFASVFTFLAVPNVLSLGTLKEVSMAHVGDYKCELLRIGGVEFRAEGVHLELDGDGNATLYWKNALGREQTRAYTYVYNQEERVMYLTLRTGKEEKTVKVPYENGEIIFSETLSGKAFFAKFSKK